MRIGKIEYESEIYNIVQETFVDSYRNLTYKAIAGCKWTSTYCKSAKLILKADDDALINVYSLFRHVESLQRTGKVINNTILCNVISGAHPVRTKNKWKVTKEEYPYNLYPPYCPGLGLIMTGDIIPKLYNQSLYEPYFWVDDVYFTGLLAQSLKIKHISLTGLVDFRTTNMFSEQSYFANKLDGIYYHIKDRPISRLKWKKAYMAKQLLFGQRMPAIV